MLYKKYFWGLLVCWFSFLANGSILESQKIVKFIGKDGSRIFANSDDLNQFFNSQQLLKSDQKKKYLRRSTNKNLSNSVSKLIDQIATQHDIDPEFVNAVARVESNLNPSAVSPKGALGVMLTVLVSMISMIQNRI